MKYKAGDYVKCIRDNPHARTGDIGLKENQIYKVIFCSKINSDTRIEELPDIDWSCTRFILYKKAKVEPLERLPKWF